jgi:hypothetical protein
MEIVVRHLAEAERRWLRCALSHRRGRLNTLRRTLPLVSVIIYGGLWGLTVLATVADRRGPKWYVSGLIWLGIGLPISLGSYIEVRKSVVKGIRRLESVVRQNAACEVRIRSNAVLEFEEQDGEGGCYAFQLDDHRVVFIVGQQFSSSARFPNSDFSMVDLGAEDGGVVAGFVRTHGARIEPIRRIPAGRKAKLKMPEHLHLMEAELSQLEELLT